jgi:hypothetical protein
MFLLQTIRRAGRQVLRNIVSLAQRCNRRRHSKRIMLMLTRQHPGAAAVQKSATGVPSNQTPAAVAEIRSLRPRKTTTLTRKTGALTMYGGESRTSHLIHRLGSVSTARAPYVGVIRSGGDGLAISGDAAVSTAGLNCATSAGRQSRLIGR